MCKMLHTVLGQSCICFSASETLSEDYTNYLTVVIKDSEKDGLKHSGEYLISDNAISFVPIPGSETYFGE